MTKKTQTRRVCFNPWTEFAHGQVKFEISTSNITPLAKIAFAPADQNQLEKLNTWDIAYKIRPRVEGAFKALPETISTDLVLNSLEQFRNSINTSKDKYRDLAREKPYHYWRHLLYQEMTNLTDTELDQIRTMCNIGFQRGVNGFSNAFGI